MLTEWCLGGIGRRGKDVRGLLVIKSRWEKVSYSDLDIPTNNQLQINFKTFLSLALHFDDKTQYRHHIVAMVL